MDNKLFNPDILLVCHISYTGLYWRTGQVIAVKKIALFISYFYKYCKDLYYTTKIISMYASRFLVEMDFETNSIFFSPWMTILIKEKHEKKQQEAIKTLQFPTKIFKYIKSHKCIISTENRMSECREMLTLLLYFVESSIQDQWIVSIRLGDSIENIF